MKSQGAAAIKEGVENEGGFLVSNFGPQKSQDWTLFGKFLDKLLFIVFVIIYAIMFKRLVP